ncbi:lysophospholipase L1-like esterase [Nitrobacteraceae bacterium AZCC 1564]
MLRARGLDVNVINAGISGDTTGGMLARLDSAVPSVVVQKFAQFIRESFQRTSEPKPH